MVFGFLNGSNKSNFRKQYDSALEPEKINWRDYGQPQEKIVLEPSIYTLEALQLAQRKSKTQGLSTSSRVELIYMGFLVIGIISES